jgi:hypothetical protein
MARIKPGLQLLLGLLTAGARVLERDPRIGADRELPLFPSEPIGEVPKPRAGRCDPKLKASAVRQLNGLSIGRMRAP